MSTGTASKSDHQWVGATYVPLTDSGARQAQSRGTARLAEKTKVDILDIYCGGCRRPYDAVHEKPCEAVENNEHLIGGPTGQRKKRKGGEQEEAV